MTKGDLAKKQEAERLEWRRRGILGVITALKPDTKEITISNRTMAEHAVGRCCYQRQYRDEALRA